MTRKRRPSSSFCALAVLALPLGARAQEIRLGNEFQVNAYTMSAQRFASVAADADGDFVIAWSSLDQDGDDTGVFARRFSSAGAPLAGEFQVNTYTTSSQSLPAVAADADGDFVVAWQSFNQDGPDYGIFARRFSSAGAPLASEFLVNTYTTDRQDRPSVASDTDGDFVVAWQTFLEDAESYGVFARRFSSAGAPQGPDFQVNTYTPGFYLNRRRFPKVASDADGDFVVTWQHFDQDGSGYGVFARLFSSAGAPLTGELQVNTYTTSFQAYPSVAADAAGNFVVAWNSSAQDGPDSGVFARLFSSAGAPLAGELQVNSYTTGPQRLGSVAASADGDFVVAWQSNLQDGSSYGVFARPFSSAGVPLTHELQVNTYTTGNQRYPSLASDANGDFVVTWQGLNQDGSSYGILAQRFAAAIILDIDGNGSAQPLTDGLLVLRRFFGFTGATLTSGVVGADCMRCDAAAIEPYIAGLGLLLDVDGNTVTAPLTDGLLALRFLFGFTGATLTSGAVGGGCTRCDALSIEAYLAGLTT